MDPISDLEIFQAALDAGFSPDQAVTMTAIALAESGGHTAALNSTGEYSVGLWQINTAVHGWDPELAEDPLNNARMAFEVSGGGADITRWTVTHEVKGARYLSFRERAEAAAAAAGHEDATGQWTPPLDYHEKGVGAAPPGSTSEPLHDPSDIEEIGGSTAAPAGESSPPASPFDSDGDGVFDSIEVWEGDDPGANEGHDHEDTAEHDHEDTAGHDHGARHAHHHDVDPDSLVNGQVQESLLAGAAGGGDALLSGAPANSWNAMVEAAAVDGVDISYSDAYRPLHDQHRLADKYGLYSEGGRAALPGTSNHGLGLAVDVNVSAHPETKAWLVEHAAEYGWEANVAGEPWHYEYNESLDPDPGRAGDSVAAVEEPPSVFDSDRDGIYDGVEAWLGTDTIEAPPATEDLTLPPIEAEEGDGLVSILARFDLDPDGRLAVGEMTSDVRADLERALTDLAVERTGIAIDPHEFNHQFDHVVQNHDGVLDVTDIDDFTGLFGIDGDS